MSNQVIRVGLVGAGYIASWHAQTLAQLKGVKLAAVCDPAAAAAKALADRYGAAPHSTLSEMLAAGACDAVHILTPPHLHREQAEACLEAGAHVLVEKPFALSTSDAKAVLDAAARAERLVAVNHNFLGLPSYRRLKELIAGGFPGRIDSADLHWRYPLAPLRSGPYGLWMLRSPENLLLELGPHLFAFAVDLFGQLDDIDLRLSKPITLPTGVALPQGWLISARAGHVDVRISLSLVEGPDDRSVSLRGVAGTARLDLAADTLVLQRPNTSELILGPLFNEFSAAGQHVRQSTANAKQQLLSLNQKSPYALGFLGMIGSFYEAIARNEPIDRRFDANSAVTVIDAIERTTARIPRQDHPAMPASVSAAQRPATELIIGGTGFIGRYLTHNLVQKGKRVRVLSRGKSNPFHELGDQVEVVPVSPNDREGLRKAMQDIETTYHLGRATENTWQGYLDNDVGVTQRIGETAVEAGVKLFVYTGTIASYDASSPGQVITEQTGFGSTEDMQNRNLYARSKALCEAKLSELQKNAGLPLVIARPGIVVGAGGPLQHWGIGRWNGSAAVKVWGDGRNILPFVLVEDVAEALARMSRADIIGQSFNLIGEPMMSACDYFDAIHELTGTRINVQPGTLSAYYVVDTLKYGLKRYLLRQSHLRRPSLKDWRSRAHLSIFSNAHAKAVLGWEPETDRRRFAERMIGGPALFGY